MEGKTQEVKNKENYKPQCKFCKKEDDLPYAWISNTGETEYCCDKCWAIHFKSRSVKEEKELRELIKQIGEKQRNEEKK